MEVPAYEAAFEYLGEGVVVSDASGRIRYVNGQIVRMLGWPRAELVGQPLTTLMPERLRQAHAIGFQRFISTGTPRVFGKPIRVAALRKDGAEVEIELTLSALPSPPGEQLIIGLMRNLHERIELERQLAVTRHMRAATDLASRIIGEEDAKVVLDRAAEALARGFSAALARIWLREPSEQTLRLTASAGLSSDIESSSRKLIDLDSYPYKVGVVARTGQPFVCNELADEDGFDRAWLEREGVTSAAVLPLVVKGDVVGVLAAFFRERLHDEVAEVLGTVAAMVAAAINGSRLHEERDQLARRVEAERTYLRSLLMEAPAAIAILRGPDHVFELSNPVNSASLGRDPTGLSVREAFPELAGQGYAELLDQVLRTGESVEATEARLVVEREPGVPQEVFANFVYQPMRGPDGRNEGVLVFGFDVTELVSARRRVEMSEQAVRLANERLSLALAAANIGTWDYDPQSALIDWDPRTRDLFGVAPGVPVDYSSFLAVLHPEDRDRIDAVVQDVLRGGSGGKYDVEFRTIGIQDQVPRWIAARGQVLFEGHAGATRFIGTVIEITERKRAEAEREQLLHELQEAVRARDAFLGVASHELRTPLAALLLQIQNLKRAADTGQIPAPRLSDRLGKAERHVERLEHLVAELLDVARISEGRMTLALDDIDLVEVVKEAIDRLGVRLDQAGCEIRLDAPPEIVGRWDRLRLEQVMMNLLENALKYGPGKPIDVRVTGADGRARVAVRDRGIGIAPEDQERIFDRFERAVSERHYGGLGLGLWIVRNLVEAHGGRVLVDSEPVVGTVFTVDLPAAGPG